MGFLRQEYWSRLPFSLPGDLPDPYLLRLLHWQVDSLPLAPLGKPLCSFEIAIFEVNILAIKSLKSKSCVAIKKKKSHRHSQYKLLEDNKRENLDRYDCAFLDTTIKDNS